MKWTIIVASLALASGTAAADPAAWCKGTHKQDPNMGGLSATDASEVIRALVSVECNPNAEVEANRADIEKARTAWGNKLGMSEGDWADAAAYATNGEPPIDYSTKKFNEMTPIDQYAAVNMSFASGNPPKVVMDPTYVADVLDAKLSEAGRLALLDRCIRDDSQILWASCQGDVDKFDPVKLMGQVRADTVHPGELRMMLRLRGYNFSARLAKHKDKVAKLIASDPGWKKFFEVAAAARNEWASLADKNAKFLAVATDADSAAFAQSRSMFEGCDDKTFAALGEAVSQLSAKQFANMHDVRDSPGTGFASKAMKIALANPAVNVAALAVYECGQHQGLARVLGPALVTTSSMRGPRNFAVAKMAGAGIQLDDLQAKIQWPIFKHAYSAEGSTITSSGAGIKSIKKQKDSLIVTPVALMVTTDDCVQEHFSNRVERIRDDGKVEYALICDKMAKRQHNDAWSDFKINAQYEKLLKPGQVFSAGGSGPNGMDILAIWSSEKAAAPMWFLAGPIK